MGELIGPSAATIEGNLRSENDSVYALNVTGVQYLRGQTNRWSGEPLTVRKEFVARARERQFSRSRTALTVGLAAGGIVAFAISRGLFGSGFDRTSNPGGGGGEQ